MQNNNHRLKEISILAFEFQYKFQWFYKIYSIRPSRLQSQEWNYGEEEAIGGEPSASVSYGTNVTVWESQLFEFAFWR